MLVFVSCSPALEPSPKQIAQDRITLKKAIKEKEKLSKKKSSEPDDEDKLISEAVESYNDQLYSVSAKEFGEILSKYPYSPYSTFAELKVADSNFYLGEYQTAQTAYEEFIKVHPKHLSAVWAKYQIGNCHFQKYRSASNDQSPLYSAIKAYQRVLNENPQSEYEASARNKINECREKLAEHEITVAKFYQKQGNKKALARRLKTLTEKYSDTKAFTDNKIELKKDFANSEEMLRLGGFSKTTKSVSKQQLTNNMQVPKIIKATRLSLFQEGINTHNKRN